MIIYCNVTIIKVVSISWLTLLLGCSGDLTSIRACWTSLTTCWTVLFMSKEFFKSSVWGAGFLGGKGRFLGDKDVCLGGKGGFLDKGGHFSLPCWFWNWLLLLFYIEKLLAPELRDNYIIKQEDRVEKWRLCYLNKKFILQIFNK